MYRYVKLMLDDSIDEVPLDQDEAVYYSRRGAEKGEGHCMYYYGLFLFDGNGVEQDREEAIELIQKARNKYIVEADYLYFRLLKFNVEKYSLSSAGICDIKDSYFENGFNYEKGINRDINYEYTLEHFKKGADSGEAACMNRYGLMVELGKGVDKNPEEDTTKCPPI